MPDCVRLRSSESEHRIKGVLLAGGRGSRSGARTPVSSARGSSVRPQILRSGDDIDTPDRYGERNIGNITSGHEFTPTATNSAAGVRSNTPSAEHRSLDDSRMHIESGDYLVLPTGSIAPHWVTPLPCGNLTQYERTISTPSVECQWSSVLETQLASVDTPS